jgi:hypothetical protein
MAASASAADAGSGTLMLSSANCGGMSSALKSQPWSV